MSKKGKLTIFFGYCAGVGKTYAMLKYAKKILEEEKKDIVIGYIQPHDRKDTIEAMQGLEQIGVAEINYKGHIFEEFDLDKALARNPEIILVDELAHTNVQSSRHKKRYQDIEELLRAGIDVYTTLNVQHLESLHDIVESITNIKVNERVPDHIFDEADDIKVVDIEVEQLVKRLEDGKIYKKSQIKRALDNFFAKNNLIALREIALRRCADRINLYSDDKNKQFIKEHILVGISPSPTNQKVIRTAYRIASSLHADFTALFVETSNTKYLTEKQQKNLKSNLELAKHLKANVVSSYGNDVAFQISQYAKISGVSKIVLGRSVQKISILRKTTIVDQITNLSPNIDIYIIPDTNFESKSKKIRFNSGVKFELKDSLITVGIFLATTLLSAIFFKMEFSTTNIVLLYVLSSCVIGYSTSNPIYNIISAIFSILTIDFMFIQPYYSLTIYSKDYPMIFIIMAIVSFFISLMQNQLKKEKTLAVKRAYNMDVLLQTSQKLQTISTYEQAANETCYELNKLLDRAVIFYPVKNGRLTDCFVYNPKNDNKIDDVFKSNKEKSVAKWVFTNNDNAGANTTTLSDSNGFYLAIRKDNEVFGVVGIDLSDNYKMTVDEKSLLKSILNEVALCMDSIKNK